MYMKIHDTDHDLKGQARQKAVRDIDTTIIRNLTEIFQEVNLWISRCITGECYKSALSKIRRAFVVFYHFLSPKITQELLFWRKSASLFFLQSIDNTQYMPQWRSMRHIGHRSKTWLCAMSRMKISCRAWTGWYRRSILKSPWRLRSGQVVIIRG